MVMTGSGVTRLGFEQVFEEQCLGVEAGVHPAGGYPGFLLQCVIGRRHRELFESGGERCPQAF